jgi:hypothetical protein
MFNCTDWSNRGESFLLPKGFQAADCVPHLVLILKQLIGL